MEQIVSRDELANQIIKNENLYPGDKMSYDRLMELSEKYRITPYVLAVNIFGATQPQFRSICSKGSNAKNFVILKHLIPEMIENAINLKQKILQEEHLQEGDSIDYNRLKEIAQKYGIQERILAINVFEISTYSYREMKRNSSKKSKILFRKTKTKNSTAKKDEKSILLREQILKDEDLKIGDKIKYEKIVYLAKKYGIDEKRLATDILGLTNSAFYHIKSDKKRKAVILSGFLDEEELQKLSKKILSAEKIEAYAQIDYNFLQELSKKYSINEKILALQILGITEGQYYNMKYSQTKKAYVLKDEKEDTKPEDLKRLKTTIFEQEHLSVGKRISFEEIETLQKKYDVSINTLLYILGISYQSYQSIKNNSYYKSIIKDTDKVLITQILAEVLEKERYYTKEEIEQICETNNISLQDFFDYVLGKATYFGREEYKKVLDSKGKLWIGTQTRLSNEFTNKNLYEILRIAEIASKQIYYKYYYSIRNLEPEDLEQEAVTMILETCGDLEKNFEGSELSRRIYLRVRKYLLRYIKTIGNPRVVSMYGYYQKDSRTREKRTDLELKDEKSNTELQAIENVKTEIANSSIIRYLSILFKNGYDRDTALQKTEAVFQISKRAILNAIKEELLKRQNSKQAKGEESCIGD